MKSVVSATPARARAGVEASILKYSPSRFIEPALGFLAIPVLTRLLGAAAYGELSIVLLTAGLLRILAFDWVANSAIRWSRPMEDQRPLLHANLVAGLGIGLIASIVIVFAFHNILPIKAVNAVGALFVWTVLDALVAGQARNAEMLLRADHRPRGFTILRAGMGVGRHVIGIAALTVFAGSIDAYFVARILSLACVGLLGWTSVGGWREFGRYRPSPVLLRAFLKFGLPLSLMATVTTLQSLGNRTVILSFVGREETGLYSAAANIGFAPVQIFQQIVMLGLYPLAIDSWERGERVESIVRNGLRWFLIGGAPALCGMALLSKGILGVVAGDEYVVAWPVLIALSGGSFLYGLSQYFSMRFMVTKETLKLAVISLSACIVNIGLAVLMVPTLGWTWAAAATVAAYGLILVCAVTWGFRPSRETVPIATVLRVTAGLVAMSASLLFLQNRMPLTSPLRLAAGVLLGGGVYIAVILLLGEMRGRRDSGGA